MSQEKVEMNAVEQLQAVINDCREELAYTATEAAHLGTLYGVLKTGRFNDKELERLLALAEVKLCGLRGVPAIFEFVRDLHSMLRDRRRGFLREMREASRARRELSRRLNWNGSAYGENYGDDVAILGGGCKCPNRPHCGHHADMHGNGFSMRGSAPARAKKQKSSKKDDRERRGERFRLRYSA